MTALGPWRTEGDVSRAFAAAEAAYLEPDEPCSVCEGECDDCVDGEVCGYCRASDGDVGDWDEHEWEMRQDARDMDTKDCEYYGRLGAMWDGFLMRGMGARR